MSAIDQMLRLHRWASGEKRRTLEDLQRLADRLRSDIGRLGAPPDDGQPADERRERLTRSIADVEAAIERARDELAVAEAELGRVQQMRQSREDAGKSSVQQRRSERAAGSRRGQ